MMQQKQFHHSLKLLHRPWCTKSKLQRFRCILQILQLATLLVIYLVTTPKVSFAIVNPLDAPNNKFGIHILSPIMEELIPAKDLVNSAGGDWGYITILVERKDRDENKWKDFFNKLRKEHIIPIVRLATQPNGNFWEKPYEGEEQAWADFLDNLNWPTKNRYVVVYNEPNHAKEWGNKIDSAYYADVLDKTITALKNKNQDFFVLNAGFDASAPQKPPEFEDQLGFMRQMEIARPGIFKRLDGWVSHSYPNPEFSGSTQASGRGSVRTWYWEKQVLQSMGVSKKMPIFITETGWKHAEGQNYDTNFYSSEKVAEYYKTAFETAWDSSEIVAVTPFLLNYQSPPFDHFSFKKYTGETDKKKIVSKDALVLGEKYPDYYPTYEELAIIGKTRGRPVQENKATVTKGEIYSTLTKGESYHFPITIVNTGQSIWNEYENVSLKAVLAGGLKIDSISIPKPVRIEPGGEYIFDLDIDALNNGKSHVVLNLFLGDKQFDSEGFEFTTEVKEPVKIVVTTSLKWKKIFSGEYMLKISGPVNKVIKNLVLSSNGRSSIIEADYLLPDYSFNFTLEKPFYKPKTIRQTVYSGENTVNFDELKPDISSALLNPKALWQLLPWSN